MNYLSLFTGIAGFDLALNNAGMTSVGMVEIDKPAQSLLRRRHPGVPLYDDVKNVGVKTHERHSVDLVCGGFPCQDLSVAGKRAGLAGKRSGLWFEFARIIDELEPQWFIIENVPGLLSSDEGRDFAVIVHWLAQRGYGVVWRILDAQYFGVPQRRRRVFIVGHLGDGCAAEVLLEQESGAWNPPPSRKTGKEVAFALRSNPSHSGDKGDGGVNTTLVASPITSASPSRRNGGSSPTDGTLIVAGTLSHSAGGLNRPAGQGNELDFLVADTLTEQYNKNREELPVIADTITSMYARNRGANAGNSSKTHNLFVMAQGSAHAEIVRDGEPSLTAHHEQPIVFQQNSRDGEGEIAGALSAEPGMKQQNYIAFTARDYGADATENLSPTLRSLSFKDSHQPGSASIGIAGNEGVRRLTPLECERLQGFPDYYTDGQSDTQRYKQLGNAVAVPVVEWIAKRIVQVNSKIQSQ